MNRMIFVNLPSRDIALSRRFYEGLGFTINPQFSDESTLCVVVSGTIFFMVMTRARFADFAPRPVADPGSVTAALIALSAGSRDEVDAFVAAAVEGGGSDNDKAQDHGFMYGRSISDPDGNVLEIFWMDPGVASGESGPGI